MTPLASSDSPVPPSGLVLSDDLADRLGSAVSFRLAASRGETFTADGGQPHGPGDDLPPALFVPFWPRAAELMPITEQRILPRLVSVGMPTSGTAPLLATAVKQVLDRAGWPVEVLLLPMGPRKRDIDFAAIHQVAARHAEVRVLGDWSPPRFAAAYNRLVSESAGEVFVMGNDDFYPLEDRALLGLVECVREPAVGVAAGRVRGRCFNSYQRMPGPDVQCPTPMLLPAFRREVFEEVGGFDEERFTGYGEEDIDFQLRVLNAGYAAALVSGLWRHHGQVTARRFSVLSGAGRKRNLRAFAERWGVAPGAGLQELAERILPRPLVSVVVAVRNPESHRWRVGGGVVDLSRRCLTELILVDDGSRDATCVEALSRTLSREKVLVRLLRSPLRIGQAAARNWGARRALGQWVYFADCDDEIHGPVVHAMAQADADVSWAGALRIHEDSGKRVGVIDPGAWSLREFGDRCRCGPGCVMIRREFLYGSLAFQPEHFQYMEDFAWFVRLRMTRARHAFIREPACTYYVRPGNNRKAPMWDLWRPEIPVHAHRYGNGVDGFALAKAGERTT
ncbi:MAG: hypothetical protein CO096_14770 [Armatimonadetes bacterium CG_4_9_14_3_um_filter_66_14]|nr:MAG: hypothetical protein CO096_14770 [Armatimonadetes bacterium CG_4_9_14_3_um_filter_66_14]